MPSSDAAVQFTGQVPANGNFNMGYVTGQSNITNGANAATFLRFTPTYTGQLTGATILLIAGITGSITAAIYDCTGPNGTPANLLATATPVVNPIAGTVTLTFPTPPTLKAGTFYAFACNQNVSTQYAQANVNNGTVQTGSYTYASWPPSTVSFGAWTNFTYGVSANPLLMTNFNYSLVSEAHQDAATSYVFDSTLGHSDFYGIAPIAVTPVATIAVTTRGLAQKSDAGTRNGAVQLKSGASTVTSSSVALTTSWGWLWRTDVNDPNTGSAWTPTGVNNAQVGPTVTA